MVFGTTSPLGAIDSGYGVEGTNTGKKGVEQVPQINPKKALAYYDTAMAEQQSRIEAGLSAYQASLGESAANIITGYSAANATLQPLSNASQQAVNRQLQFLGITPMSTTASYGSRLTGIDPTLRDAAAQIDALSTTQDKQQRDNLYAAINNRLSSTTAGRQDALEQQLAYFNSPEGSQQAYDKYTREYIRYRQQEAERVGAMVTADRGTSNGNAAKNPATKAADIADALKNVAPAISKDAFIKSQLDIVNASMRDKQGIRDQLVRQFQEDFNNAYTPEYQRAFTKDEVQQQIESTPGYGFQLDQGNQQVLRNQAAIGNLGSGNTQVALTQYGQGLASNYFNTYMNSLSNVINQGSGATGQIAGNQINQGGYLASLNDKGGQAANAAQQAIGQSRFDGNAGKANISFNAAAANANFQYNAYAINQGKATNLAAQSLSTAASLGSAQIAASSNERIANAQGSGLFNGYQSGQLAPNQSTDLNNSYRVSSNGGAA
jgi:hypothetical protein